MELFFATHNKNKVAEIQQLLSDEIIVKSLIDLEEEEIPETGSSIRENSAIKAQYIHSKYQAPCFADDTGLEVEALNGEPGIYSARYAGSGDSNDNITLLLQNLKGQKNRRALFKTIVTYIEKTGQLHQFEGIVKGHITDEKSGSAGFGYDPVFRPSGLDITFAEMPMDEKNKISHRSIAMKKLVEHLTNL
jgi:XTP/dITP diphosphohydrolase